jgi:threonine dehydrogenase-like Zn-dependent dehydrogenase
VVDEIRLVGSRCGPFERALSLLGSGRIDPKILVEAVYPLSRAPEAFEHAGSPGALKVLLKSR